MTPAEFADRFEVLYNNLLSNAAPGLDEYEKSVLLTKAQLEIIKNYFSSGGNKYREGFDDSAKRQQDFSTIIKTVVLSQVQNDTQFDSRAVSYALPNDLLFVIGETLQVGLITKQVIPISFDEYTRLMSKPYKRPLKNQAWRLITQYSESSPVAEIVTTLEDDSKIKVYRMRYVGTPKPIIVGNLHDINDSLYIDGEFEPSSGSLPESMHEEVLQRAVELAKASYASDQSGQAQLQNQITVGQRSE